MSTRGTAMSAMTTIKATSMKRLLPLVAAAAALLLTAGARAAAPGITGPTFALTAQPAYLTQPDGQAVYSWGYGCTTPTGHTFVPATLSATVPGNIPITPFCNTMQVPGPTLVVRSEEHTSELQSRRDLVCRLLL